MSVIYDDALKTTRMQATRDAFDAGAGPATLEIGTAGMAAVLCIVTLADPASSVAGPVLTLLGVPKSGTATGAGTAAEARIKDSTGLVRVSGLTVGTGAQNVVVSNTTIAVNDIVQVDSGTITHG
jgi:hypothetical protein